MIICSAHLNPGLYFRLVAVHFIPWSYLPSGHSKMFVTIFVLLIDVPALFAFISSAACCTMMDIPRAQLPSQVRSSAAGRCVNELFSASLKLRSFQVARHVPCVSVCILLGFVQETPWFQWARSVKLLRVEKTLRQRLIKLFYLTRLFTVKHQSMKTELQLLNRSGKKSRIRFVQKGPHTFLLQSLLLPCIQALREQINDI